MMSKWAWFWVILAADTTAILIGIIVLWTLQLGLGVNL